MSDPAEFNLTILAAHDNLRPRILKGKAVLRVDQQTLHIFAKSPIPLLPAPPFYRHVTRQIPLDQIIDVDCDRDIVSFDRRSTAAGGEQIHTYAFRAPDRATAKSIADLLPSATTPGFVQRRQEDEAFAQALGAAAPGSHVTWIILAVNILIYLAMVLSGVDWYSPKSADVLKWGANFAPYTLNGQWWRLLSAAFLHFGIIHIASNMWALYAAGDLTERLFGNRFYALIYLFGAIASSMASTWWSPGAIEAGASGAVFAIYGALLAYLLFQRKSFPAGVVQPMIKSTLFFIGYNVYFGLTTTSVSNSAHLGGLLSGFVMGMLVCRPLDSVRRATQAVPRTVAGLTLAVASLGLGGQYLHSHAQILLAGPAFRQHLQTAWIESQQIAAVWNKFQQAADAGTISQEELDRHLRQDVIPRQVSVIQQLAAVPVENNTSQTILRDALIEPLHLRLQAYAKLNDAMRSGSHAALLESENLQGQANVRLLGLGSQLGLSLSKPRK